jgi:uncharacterized membrane protein
MTLLVVGIRVPSGTSAETLGRALRSLGSSFASYGLSFIVIGFYWLGFHRQVHSWNDSTGPHWSLTCCS